VCYPASLLLFTAPDFLCAVRLGGDISLRARLIRSRYKEYQQAAVRPCFRYREILPMQKELMSDQAAAEAKVAPAMKSVGTVASLFSLQVSDALSAGAAIDCSLTGNTL
jgi:hypothetical protein